MAANLPRPEVRLFGAAEENVNSDDDEDDVEDEQLHFAFAGGSTAKEKEKEIVKEKEEVSVPSLSAANSNDAQQRRRRSIELGPGGVPAVFASSGPTAKRAKETAKTQAKRLIGRAEFQSAPMRFPPYARPLEIGSFGLDGQRRMSIGRALLRRFRMPELHVDLEHGFERFVERDPNRPEYLDNLLEFLRFASANEMPEARGMRAAKKEKEGSTGKKDEAAAAAAAAACLPMRWEKPFDCDVVCWRGLLTKVGRTSSALLLSSRVRVCFCFGHSRSLAFALDVPRSRSRPFLHLRSLAPSSYFILHNTSSPTTVSFFGARFYPLLDCICPSLVILLPLLLLPRSSLSFCLPATKAHLWPPCVTWVERLR